MTWLEELKPWATETISFLGYHLISLVLLSVISLTILVHVKGGQKNHSIALKYDKIISPLLSKWFKKYDNKLVYEAPNIIKMYPSERDSCLFAIVSLALIPRHKILSLMLNPIFFKMKDELVVEIPISLENPVSLTAAIVRRKQIKTITKKSFPDIKQLCKQYRPKAVASAQGKSEDSQPKFNVPDSHCLLVEKVEHVRYFLYSEKETAVWMKHGKSVKLVYVSDVNKFSRYPMAARLVMNLNEEDIPPMLEWMISFVDRLAKMKMSQGERKEALKKRETLDIKYE